MASVMFEKETLKTHGLGTIFKCANHDLVAESLEEYWILPKENAESFDILNMPEPGLETATDSNIQTLTNLAKQVVSDSAKNLYVLLTRPHTTIEYLRPGEIADIIEAVQDKMIDHVVKENKEAGQRLDGDEFIAFVKNNRNLLDDVENTLLNLRMAEALWDDRNHPIFNKHIRRSLVECRWGISDLGDKLDPVTARSNSMKFMSGPSLSL